MDFFNGIFIEHPAETQKVLERCVADVLMHDAEADVEFVLYTVNYLASHGRRRDSRGSALHEYICKTACFFCARRNWQRRSTRVWRNAESIDAMTSGNRWDRELPCDETPIDLRISVRELMASAVPLDREIIRLFYWEGLSHLEIADRLSLCPVVCRQRLQRARARMRKQWFTGGLCVVPEQLPAGLKKPRKRRG